MITKFYRHRWDWSGVPRPRIDVSWSGEVEWYVALSISDGHSDAIWMIEWDCTFTEAEATSWRGRLIDRLQAACSWTA